MTDDREPLGRFVAADDKAPMSEAVRDLVQWLDDRNADPVFQVNLLASTLVTQTARLGLPADAVGDFLRAVAQDLPQWSYGLRVLNLESDDDDER